jgi:hypothetical protein
MAVKVMVAPAIANGRLTKPATQSSVRAGEKARPRRRRSSVYDADGNEVFITLICLKCHNIRPLSSFGLRKMADGSIRNQPWCRTCRSAPNEKPHREETPRKEDSPAAGEPQPAASSPAHSEPARRATGSVAAEVAAALAAGLRR